MMEINDFTEETDMQLLQLYKDVDEYIKYLEASVIEEVGDDQDE